MCKHDPDISTDNSDAESESFDHQVLSRVSEALPDEHQKLSDDPRDDDEDLKEDEPGCEDFNLVNTGVSKVYRLGSPVVNEAGRDFNVRYCDQKSAGGGWTVREMMKQILFNYDVIDRSFSAEVISEIPRKTSLAPGEIINLGLATSMESSGWEMTSSIS